MEQTQDRFVSMRRTFQAPLALVWEAWTQAEHIANWWGPKGMPLSVVEFDFRVGGKWQYSMPMPNGGEFISEGEYQEIVEHQKIVTTADFKPMTTGVILHIEFEADGEQTHMNFSVEHDTAEYARKQKEMGFEKGWGSAFDRLAERLAS